MMMAATDKLNPAALPELVEAATTLLAKLDEAMPARPDGEKPTIAELERILAASDSGAVEIKPDGSIHVAPRAEIEALRASLAKARGQQS